MLGRGRALVGEVGDALDAAVSDLVELALGAPQLDHPRPHLNYFAADLVGVNHHPVAHRHGVLEQKGDARE